MGKNYFVTGGAGFIGSNYAARLIDRGEKVTVFDNLGRRGTDRNLKWLVDTYGAQSFSFIHGDVRDASLLTAAMKDADIVVHLAGQVAVTTSVFHPRDDFENNALGTFNVLEAARLSERLPLVLYASTNKVYGGMEDVRVVEESTRYRYGDLTNGVSETQGLDFHSPYGCSKGAGDQYVRDYHRIYGLPTVVLRQSCIYGPRQFGIEDQGWVAWFIIAAITGNPITIFGDGKQVRDVLHVYDLLDAYDLCVANAERAAGKIYNVGGGINNVLSVWAEFKPLLEKLLGNPIPVKSADWRPGDQKVYVSDIRKVSRELGWAPKISVEAGISQLVNWVKDNKSLFS